MLIGIRFKVSRLEMIDPRDRNGDAEQTLTVPPPTIFDGFLRPLCS